MTATLQEFWDGQVLTVSDLIDSTGLTRATVHSVCNELIDRGWIRELSDERRGTARQGRPARRFELARDAGYVLGLDVSEVHLDVIVADLTGHTLFERGFELPYVLDAAERSRQLATHIDESLAHASVTRDQLLVASVGVATPVSRHSDVIGMGEPIDTTTELWRGIRHDVDLLRAAFGDLTVLFANDANLALHGERWRGVARGVENVVVLLGNEDNVGAAIMESGRVLYGRLGGAGEMYWLNEDGGTTLGTESIARLAMRCAQDELGDAGAAPPVALPAGSHSADIALADGAGDDAGTRRVAARIAQAIMPMIRVLSVLLNPELIVLSGAVPRWRDAVVACLVEADLGDVHDPPRIESSTLGDATVAIGAVWLALDHIHQNALHIRPLARA